MAAVRTFVLPHYPEYPVQVALFKDVSNASFLRSQLLEANPDFDYAFIDATMVRHTSSQWRGFAHSMPIFGALRSLI